jgi:hypothetical protein
VLVSQIFRIDPIPTDIRIVPSQPVVKVNHEETLTLQLRLVFSPKFDEKRPKVVGIMLRSATGVEKQFKLGESREHFTRMHTQLATLSNTDESVYKNSALVVVFDSGAVVSCSPMFMKE